MNKKEMNKVISKLKSSSVKLPVARNFILLISGENFTREMSLEEIQAIRTDILLEAIPELSVSLYQSNRLESMLEKIPQYAISTEDDDFI